MFKKKFKNTNGMRQKSSNLKSRASNYSYYEARSDKDTQTRSRPDDKRLNNQNLRTLSRPWYMKVLNVLIVIVVLGLVIYDLGLNTRPTLIISGNTDTTSLFSVSKTRYQQAADSLFAQSIASRTKLSIDTNALASKFAKEFPELASVSIILPLIGHQPSIIVAPAQPVLIVNSQSDSFLLSDTGHVLAESSKSWPANDLPVLINETSVQYKLGTVAIDPADISFIKLVVSQFEAKKLTITSMKLPAQTRELDVTIADTPYYIKFNLNDNTNVQQQIGTYFATKDYLANNNITPTQYIDARVLGRVYYK